MLIVVLILLVRYEERQDRLDRGELGHDNVCREEDASQDVRGKQEVFGRVQLYIVSHCVVDQEKGLRSFQLLRRWWGGGPTGF